jgi:hypothetical protein
MSVFLLFPADTQPMEDLTRRAEKIVSRKSTYTTEPSTCFRIFEIMEKIPQPTFVRPEESETKKRKDISRI